MEREVGEIFRYENTWLVVYPNGRLYHYCEFCYFSCGRRCTAKKALTGECNTSSRKDKTAVNFVKIKEPK